MNDPTTESPLTAAQPEGKMTRAREQNRGRKIWRIRGHPIQVTINGKARTFIAEVPRWEHGEELALNADGSVSVVFNTTINTKRQRFSGIAREAADGRWIFETRETADAEG